MKYNRVVAVLAVVFVTLVISIAWIGSFLRGNVGNELLFSSSSAGRSLEEFVTGKKEDRTISVFSAFPPLDNDSPVARKHRQDLERLADMYDNLRPQGRITIDLQILTIEEQRSVVSSCGGGGGTENKRAMVERYDSLGPSLAQELFKFCALLDHGGMYLHESSPIVNISVLQRLLDDQRQQQQNNNVGVLMDSFAEHSIHGSFLFLRHSDHPVARDMVRFLMDTPLDELRLSPMLVPRTLYDSISRHNQNNDDDEWTLFQQRCTVNPFRVMDNNNNNTDHPSSNRYSSDNPKLTYGCPESTGFCCLVHDPVEQQAFIATKYPILPLHRLPADLPQPYNKKLAGNVPENELPFISTVRGRDVTKLNKSTTKSKSTTFYQRLEKNKCLPSTDCNKCLENKKGSTCAKCKKECGCYCKTLCHEKDIPEPYIATELVVTPPSFHKDPYRLIPRIVHQTWFEQLTPSKYPHIRRLVESLAESGWEYRFYTDDDAAAFLSTHFPPEVREAYDALIPGAFKADLFRYCALLIHGGVYADVDILAGSNLDHAVGPDVGFMVPQDEPGKRVDEKSCLWNGFIAAAPAHPYLAKVIESVVNNIRNRFTAADFENMFCPITEMSTVHKSTPLFVGGPCILGSMVNVVHNRHGLTKFYPGEFWSRNNNTSSIDTDFTESRIPGRTVILKQNKWDMGAHRFTLLEKNLIVASTDFPAANDRENQDNYEHYSTTFKKYRLYGIEGVYRNKHIANEELRVVVDDSIHRQRQSL